MPNHDPSAEPWTAIEVIEQIEQLTAAWLDPSAITPELAQRIQGYEITYQPQNDEGEKRLIVAVGDDYYRRHSGGKTLDLRYEERHYGNQGRKDRLVVAHLKSGSDYFIGQETHWDRLDSFEGTMEQRATGQPVLDSIPRLLKPFEPADHYRNFSLHLMPPRSNS